VKPLYETPDLQRVLGVLLFRAEKTGACSTVYGVARCEASTKRPPRVWPFASLGAVSRRVIRSHWCRFRGCVRGTTPGPFGVQRHLRHDVSNLSLTLRTSWSPWG